MERRWVTLNELVKEIARDMGNSALAEPYGQVASAPKSKSTKEAVSTSYCQWSVLPNDAFMPSGPKIQTLDAGVYNVAPSDNGPVFVRAKLITDDLVTLEDSANERVLASMKKFWESKAEYSKRGIVYKRGILLDGPAGSGKTSTVNLLTKILIGMDGIVLICGNPMLMAVALDALRRIEPDRNLIVIYEDIDELIKQYNEHAILSLLDGEAQIDNVVNIATTNFPEELGARICNRPSRFDERITVGMPTTPARNTYIHHILREETVSEDEIQKWVKETDGFSVAHLKELAIAVFCLQQPYDTVLKRLKDMQIRPRGIPEFRTAGKRGFVAYPIGDEKE
jgi:ATPase family associated with various cellular activities (AAA)